MTGSFVDQPEWIDRLAEQGFIVIPEALPAAGTDGLLQEWQRRYAAGASTAAQIGRAYQQQTSDAVRSDRIHWLESNDSQPDVARFFQLIRAWSRAVNQSLFLALNAFECHFACYEPGTFYQKHRDRFQSDNGRRLSLVFFLNRNWQPHDGGELVIYNPLHDHEILHIIPPSFGTLVIFDSERFPHEVRPTHRQRLSLTGWLKSIPAHEAVLQGTALFEDPPAP